jgi:hypothetical protein
METLPKIKIKKLESDNIEILDFEQAKDFPYRKGQIIAVEGHLVSSYEDILALVEKNQLKTKEYLNVQLFPIFLGG